MTDGDKIAAAVMAASLCSKVNANPDEYVQNYFDILQKMSQQEGAAQQRRWNAPKFAERDLSRECRSGANPYSLSHFFSIMRVSTVFLKLLPAGIRAAPAMRMATCVHEPSAFFLKASQDTSARPAGHELIV